LAHVERALRDVLDIKPDSWLAPAWIGTAYHSSGKPAEALHHAERLFALSPMPLAAGVLGDALVSAGESVRAAKLLEKRAKPISAAEVSRVEVDEEERQQMTLATR
jgi:tetratricopeptide (TPR) repeat protein